MEASQLRRRLLGLIALILILAGAAGHFLGGGSSTQIGLFTSACGKAGLVLGALWLAFPQVVELSTRIPPWLLGVLLLSGLVVVIRPRSIAFVAPLVAVLLVMQFVGFLLRPAPRRPRPTDPQPHRKPDR